MTTNIISNTPESERDSWRTPKYLIDFVRKTIGGINYDTACTASNCVATPVFYASDTNDALSVYWSENCFCNPPYSDIEPWVTKAINSKDAITAMLIPCPNGESYYKNLIPNSHEIYINGRISFIDASGKPKNGNTRGTSIFIVNGYGQGGRTVIDRDSIKGAL